MMAREVALAVARDVFAPAHNTPARGAQESLDYRLQRAALDSRDTAFATTLAFGAIKMRRAIDWYLKPYLSDRNKALPAAIAEILRLALYELRWMRTPERAVVSEWVELAKKYGHRGTAGLVNAVLRSFLRERPPAPERTAFESDDEYLATLYSFPTWIVRQWREVLGSEMLPDVLEACNKPAQTAVSVNRQKQTREGLREWFGRYDIAATFSTIAEDSLVLSGSAVHGLQPQAHGNWWVQSESSASVVDVLNPQPGESVADACSGRGSKALQIAARLEGGGTFVCVDRDARKNATLQRRAQEAGLAMAVVTDDATHVLGEQRFDRILIDAPCSGTGVVGRHPEARWRKQPSDGERLASTQRALIGALAERLHEGGSLVYAVCSIDPRETVEVIEASADEHRLRRGLIPAALAEFETNEGDVLIPPGLHGRDGFYVSRLERSS